MKPPALSVISKLRPIYRDPRHLLCVCRVRTPSGSSRTCFDAQTTPSVANQMHCPPLYVLLWRGRRGSSGPSTASSWRSSSILSTSPPQSPYLCLSVNLLDESLHLRVRPGSALPAERTSIRPLRLPCLSRPTVSFRCPRHVRGPTKSAAISLVPLFSQDPGTQGCAESITASHIATHLHLPNFPTFYLLTTQTAGNSLCILLGLPTCCPFLHTVRTFPSN